MLVDEADQRHLDSEQAPGEAVRLALRSAHYRQPLDWNDEVVITIGQRLVYGYRYLGRAADAEAILEDPRNWVAQPIINLSNTYNQLQSSAAAFGKLFRLLDTEPAVTDLPDAEDLPEPVEAGPERRRHPRPQHPAATREPRRRSRHPNPAPAR